MPHKQVHHTPWQERELLKQRGIRVIESPIARAVGNARGHLAGLVLQDGCFMPLGWASTPLLPQNPHFSAWLGLACIWRRLIYVAPCRTRPPAPFPACALCRALFFNTGRIQSSSLPEKMGLPTDELGDIVCETKGNVQAVVSAWGGEKAHGTCCDQQCVTAAPALT